MPLSNTSSPSSSSSKPKNRHRKRISALRLSSDTTATLPAYIPVQSAPIEDSDRPPDYPDSAEEADSEDSTEFNPYPTLSSPSLLARKSLSRRLSNATPPSRRVASAQSHRRKKSWAHPLPQKVEDEEDNSTDPYLDALLARSVHALEMSNTLLQSTMATQTSLSDAVSAADEYPTSPSSHTLTLMLTGGDATPPMSVRRAGKQSRWADDVSEVSRDIDNMYESSSTTTKPLKMSSRTPSTLVSSSLPTPSALSSRHRRLPPSLDLRHDAQLKLSDHDRSRLVAPPPRALTQYVASASTPYLPDTASEHTFNDDDEIISLPSTLGLRASSSISHLPLTNPPPNSAGNGSLQLSNNLKLHSALSSPRVTDKHHEPSTPAYNMLASFVSKPSPQVLPTNTMLSSSPFTSSLAFLSKSRSSSSSSSVPRGPSRKGSLDFSFSSPRSESRSEGTRTPERPSRSSTPKLSFAKTLPSATSSTFQSRRPMTPPVEESSNSSSSDGEGFKAKLTVQSLRKILDEQPAPPVNASTMTVSKLKAPAFHPRTPGRTPSTAGTSTTTASVSRLLTRNRHLLTAGGPPTHSPSSSISTPGAGPSRLASEAGTSSPMLSVSPPRRGAFKGSRANSQVNSPIASVPPSPGLRTPTTSTAAAELAGVGPIAPPSAGLTAWTFLTKGVNTGSRTPTSIGSGRSTPKRISFAELPEAYNSGADEDEEDEEDEEDIQDSKGKGKAKARPVPKKKSASSSAPKRQPGESSEKFRQQREGRRQRRRREQRLKRSSTDGSSSDSNLKWWNWILGVPTNTNAKRYEDKIEERLNRGGLGAGMGGGGGLGGGFGGGGEWGV